MSDSLSALNEFLKNKYWPNLNSNNYKITSKATSSYNCVAWAILIINKWIAHDANNWYQGVPRTQHINSYIIFFGKFGFNACRDGGFEKRLEKIALYYDNDQQFQHVAFQHNKNKWASKLGEWEDIYHDLPRHLGGGDYGTNIIYMSRKKTILIKLKRFILSQYVKYRSFDV